MTSAGRGPLSRRKALLDLLLIVGVLLGSKAILLQVDAVWMVAGPISLIITLFLALVLIRWRAEGVQAIGLRRPKTAQWLALWTLFALVVTIVAGGLAESVALSVLGGPTDETLAIDAQYQGRFDNVPGNREAYLFWIATAWVVGGFTEEILFRGILILRLEQAMRRVPLAPLLAILGQAIIFGQQHAYYQGLTGWIATGAIALVSGLIYLGLRRNLWPLILSHGISNTIGLTLIYLS